MIVFVLVVFGGYVLCEKIVYLVFGFFVFVDDSVVFVGDVFVIVYGCVFVGDYDR